MTKGQLQKKIAYLESLNDHLLSEVSYIDHLMRLIGFSQGLQSVKATANEILEKGINIEGQHHEDENNEELEESA